MTSRLTETQNLIADIDNLLANKRQSRFLSNQGSEPRKVLERIREFLVRLSESDENQHEQERQTSPLLVKFAGGNRIPSEQEDSGVVTSQESNQVSSFLAPLQAELQSLLNQRASLVEEIRQLEQKRLHNYSLAQQLANQEHIISEFLQVLRSRLLASSPIEGGANLPERQSPNIEAASSFAQSPFLESSDQMERLTRLARDLDQKLLALDGTVNVVFEGLQRNIYTYHESLSDALARMHSKGTQGEQLLTSLINNLTQHLQQNTPTHEPSTDNLNSGKTPETTLDQSLASQLPKPLQVEAAPTLSPQNQLITPEVSHNSAITPDVDEPKTVQVETAPTFSPQNQPITPEVSHDTGTTPYLDAALLEFGEDTQAPIPTIARDEVDQLYASLFGTETRDDATDIPVNVSVDVTTSSSTLDVNDTPVAPEVVSEQETSKVQTPKNFIDELFMDAPASSAPIKPVRSPDVAQPATTEGHKTISFIDELFMDAPASPSPQPPSPAPSPVISQPLTSERPKAIISFIDEMFMDALASPSPTTPPSTEISLIQSNELLNEVGVDSPASTVDEVKNITNNSSINESNASSIVDNTTDNLPTSTTNQEQLVDSDISIPDPWLEASAARVVEPSDDTEDTREIPVEHTGVESPESAEAISLVEKPSSADTIRVLTDLFAEVSDEEESVEATTPLATAPTDSQEQPSVEVSDRRDTVSSSEYIAASPTEDLLLEVENQLSELADISIEESQLQQLEQDLASFDGELNALLQPLTPENGEIVQNRLIPPEEQQQSDTEVNSSPEEAQAAETEKKKEAPEQLVGSSVSISHSANNGEFSQDPVNTIWYLGIDLGTTGISAALLNRSTTEVYPLYWMAENQQEASSIKKSFRLPAEVYLPNVSVPSGETDSKDAHEQTTPAAVAEERGTEQEETNSQSTPTHNVFSAQLKPYLQLALPYKKDRQKWEPVLQLNEFSTVPLVWVVRSLSKLLLTLMSDRTSTTLGLTAAAVGMEQDTFSHIISHITGVICTCPSNWSEQYRFNIREALLTSKLVKHAQQVFFVEEAIATLLSELDGAGGEIVKIKSRQGFRPAKTSDRPLVGNTLVINIGASTTEMGLVDLPENLEDLTHNDFMLHGFAYAGKGIEQDIICQLLLSPKWQQPRNETEEDSKAVSSKPWHWQPSIPGLDRMRFASLRLEELNLPRAGEPDIVDRIRLQQRLESALLGKAVIDAAVALKLILQHQESFTLELADRRWILHRRDLESQVFVPFVRRLNRELNRLLVAKGTPTEAINQGILTGGVASLGAVSRWLRQKLPNAKIIQDLYLGENGSPTCSRVAYGLAALPLHPQVLEVPRQQYTDYFLFTELLRVLPTRAISFSEVIQLFENRGINTRSCQQRLLAFLEGELPPGLVPSSQDATWLTLNSSENSNYKAVTAKPLFEKQGSLTYRLDPQQLRSIAHYLDAIKSSTQQSLDEPYTVNFAVGVV
ncbi:MAG: hypothetical protein SAK29_30275 [Scytonema sp. PMC 1069.18]|nr:hypothetical protein [Scytonema sp. PMC 1069.18]MEC4886979.1 hypothetical protein [Scytonema sp. PMC 1070.18]